MITVKNLTKRYGDFKAIDNLSFEIEDGHIYGFLGPNGAGKSTTLNIMTGVLAATKGEVLIDGLDIFEDAKEAKKRIGYLPEIPPLYIDQTPTEYLTFVAQAKKISRKELAGEIAKVIAETHIESVADKRIRYLSKGYRQRVGIAQALLGNPRVIILDEPTVGLDPVQIIEIRDLIHELGRNHTVILSSHILSEVQAICERILILYKGKLVAFDTTENLQDSFSGTTTIHLQAEGTKEAAEKILEEIEGISIDTIEGSKDICDITLTVDTSDSEKSHEECSREVCRRIFYAFAAADIALLQMTTTRASLEDIFIELTNDNELPAEDKEDMEDGDDENAVEEVDEE